MKKVALITTTLCLFLISGCSGHDKTQRPGWVDNAQSLYPNSQYLTAVGEASNRNLSSKNAKVNLAEIFSVNIRSESKLLTQAIKTESRLGMTLESTNALQKKIETETQQTIQGVEIKESWLSPNGDYYTLAVLNKRTATQNLMQSIADLDEQTQGYIKYSVQTAPNAILALNALRSARDLQVTRNMLNLQLTYVSGSGLLNDLSQSDIEQLIQRKLASLKVSVVGEQPQILQSELATLGMTVSEQANIELTPTLVTNDAFFANGWYWLRGSYQLTLSENGTVISSQRWPLKVSAQREAQLNGRLQAKLAQNAKAYLQQLMSDQPAL